MNNAAIFCLFLVFSCAGNAAQSGDYSYEVNQSTITITGYTGSGGAVTIPETIDGLPVASVGARAFYNLITVTSITIPHNVTNIGDLAFVGCTSLNAIAVDAHNSFYTNVDGVLFNKSQLWSPNSVAALIGNELRYFRSSYSITSIAHV